MAPLRLLLGGAALCTSYQKIESQIFEAEHKLQAADSQEKIQTHMKEFRKLNIDKARLEASVFVLGAFTERATREAAPRDNEDAPQVRALGHLRRFVEQLRTKQEVSTSPFVHTFCERRGVFTCPRQFATLKT